MLENYFTKYDNDFITAWCKYLITNDNDFAKANIQALAHLGQINAIQDWYLMKNPEDKDEVIDKIVCKYELTNFNEVYALGCFYKDKESAKIDEIIKKVKALDHEKIEMLNRTSAYYPNQDDIFKILAFNQDFLSIERQLDNLQAQYSKLQNSQYRNYAVSFAKSMYKARKNPLYYERALEILHDDYFSNDSIILPKARKIQRKLHKLYKSNPEDPSVKFALAKNLYYFSYGKKRELGKKMLKELATRDFSVDFLLSKREENKKK